MQKGCVKNQGQYACTGINSLSSSQLIISNHQPGADNQILIISLTVFWSGALMCVSTRPSRKAVNNELRGAIVAID